MSKSVAAEARSGDQRRALVAMRDKLATAMDEASTEMLPQVSGRLQAVLVAIAELDAGAKPKEVSPSDDLRARREARRSATEPVASASRSRVKRGS
jgi:hypothetical protein